MQTLISCLRCRLYFFRLICFLLLFGLAFQLAAQEEDNDSYPEEEEPVLIWDFFEPDQYMAGDQVLNISAGIIFPTIFTGSGMEGNPSNLKLGGMGNISYSFFLTPNWFVGGEFLGMFAGTGGGNMLYIIGIGGHGGYLHLWRRFEFPVRLTIAAAPQMYLEKNHLGILIKPGASAYFRYNVDWSFGINANWWMMPQAPKNKKFVMGNFLEFSFSARYHPRRR